MYNYEKIFANPFFYLTDPPLSVEEFNKFRYHGMYTVVDNDWVVPFSKWLKAILNKNKDWICVELMAGRGWLANALELNGVEVIASDDFSDFVHRSHLGYPDDILAPVFQIEEQDAEQAAKEIHNEVMNNPELRYLVILSYPPSDSTAETITKILPDGSIVIYIGDPEFYYTADDNFRNSLNWLHVNKNHPDYFLYQSLPKDLNIEGVGMDGEEEKTTTAEIWLGIVSNPKADIYQK